MSYFIFNSFDSRDLGIIIRSPAVRPSWSEELKEIVIPGASKRYMQHSGNYPNAEFTIETTIPTSPENLRQIYSTLNGQGVLWLSSSPDEYLDAIIAPLVPEPVALLTAELPVGVTVLPFAKAVNPTIVDLTSATDFVEVVNSGTVTSYPEFSFIPTGDTFINVNGSEFAVTIPDGFSSGASVVVNTSVPVVYWEKDGVKHNMMQFTSGDFPLLHTGSNYIKHGGNVTSMSVNVKEEFL